jgi:hypothetical protein
LALDRVAGEMPHEKFMTNKLMALVAGIAVIGGSATLFAQEKAGKGRRGDNDASG